MSAAILTDMTRCIGCEACVMACKETNGLPVGTDSKTLSADTWCAVHEEGDQWVRQQCMHCLDPACVTVCPVGALQKTHAGPVIYDESRCIGCRYCMIGCPFGIPKYEWDEPLPRIQKCILCFDKHVKEGRQPACTTACPTGAIVFGEREPLIEEAHRRIAASPDTYVDHVYGEHEAGGTSVLYLSGVAFEEVGFRTDLRGSPYPKLTWDILSKIPNVVGIVGVMLCGIWWITGRRDTLDEVRKGHLSLEEAMERRPPLMGKERHHDRHE